MQKFVAALFVAVLFVGCGTETPKVPVEAEAPRAAVTESVSITPGISEVVPVEAPKAKIVGVAPGVVNPKGDDDGVDRAVVALELPKLEKRQLEIPRQGPRTIDEIVQDFSRDRAENPDNYSGELPALFTGAEEGTVVKVKVDGMFTSVGFLPTPMSIEAEVVVSSYAYMTGLWHCQGKTGECMFWASDYGCRLDCLGMSSSGRGFDGLVSWSGKVVVEGDHFTMVNPEDNNLDAEEILNTELPNEFEAKDKNTLGKMVFHFKVSRKDEEGSIIVTGVYVVGKTPTSPRQSGVVFGVIYGDCSVGLLMVPDSKEGEIPFVDTTEATIYRKDGEYILVRRHYGGVVNHILNEALNEMKITIPR